jgi:hypothetical protein
MALTQEKAIQSWAELQRHMSTKPDEIVEQSLSNLESWACKRGLKFCYNHDDNTWILVPIDPCAVE